MNAIFKGFMSLFDWILVDFSKSPSERVDEILEDHYNKKLGVSIALGRALNGVNNES
jgi:uncharacterized protein (DUF2336 family)